MKVRLTLLFILSSLQAALSLPYKGKGEVCIASYSRTGTGARFIYRPENYESYERWTAVVDFAHSQSKRHIMFLYDDIIIKNGSVVPMLWDAVGKYFYYQQTAGTLQAHDWYGYAVYIHNLEGQLVYQDTHHFFKMPPSYGYCSLDSRGDVSSRRCSQVLTSATAYQEELAEKPAVTAYKGNGKIYVTGVGYPSGSRGARIIYRPQNYQKYSPLGQGWIAYIGFYGSTDHSSALKNYYQVIDNRTHWPTLEWDSKGKYYHYTQYGDTISHSLFGYGVDIENIDGQLIYEDTHHFYLAPSLKYGIGCQLDIDHSSYNIREKCSQALRKSGAVGKPASDFDAVNLKGEDGNHLGVGTSKPKGDSRLGIGLGVTAGIIGVSVLASLCKVAVRSCADDQGTLPDVRQEGSTTVPNPTFQQVEEPSAAVKLIDSDAGTSVSTNTPYPTVPPPAYNSLPENV